MPRGAILRPVETLTTRKEPNMGKETEESGQRLTAKNAAAYLGISLSKLKQERLKGATPAFIRIGRRVLYDTRDLDLYLNANRQEPTSMEATSCR